jgi:hypothetical protein
MASAADPAAKAHLLPGQTPHYIVAAEYRFTGEQAPGGPQWAVRDSGVMVHSQAVETMTKLQNFPISIEVQLLGGSGAGRRTTANLWHGRHARCPRRAAFHHALPQFGFKDLPRGPMSAIRKVELLNLAGCMDPKASNYKSYYRHAVPSACRYAAR